MDGTFAFANKGFIPEYDVVVVFNRRADDRDALVPAVTDAVEAGIERT